MKKLLIAIGLFGLFTAPLTFACDEMCLKEKAVAKSGEEFPSYLSWKYCEGIKGDFMTSSMKSLQSYTNTHLDVRRKRGMRNTENYLEQRADWLSECDNYIAATGKGRIFKDDKTTDNILAAIHAVSAELSSLVKGVTYANQEEPDTKVASEKFTELFTLVDNHKNLLLLKGQYVYR